MRQVEGRRKSGRPIWKLAALAGKLASVMALHGAMPSKQHVFHNISCSQVRVVCCVLLSVHNVAHVLACVSE